MIFIFLGIYYCRMERIDYILDFCKELGKEMIACGANIERVNLTTEKICHAYGLHDVTCANLTTRISISAKDENKLYREDNLCRYAAAGASLACWKADS